MIKIQVPRTKNEIQKQIKALEYLIKKDKSNKDKQVHQKALVELKEALKEGK